MFTFRYLMTESSDKRRIKFVKDPVTVWKVKFEGECERQLDLIKTLPKSKRRYLEKRLEVIK